MDLARGLAILGMLTAHLLTRPELAWTDASTWMAIVDGRSSILFATLAGVSIGLVTGGRRPLPPEDMRIAHGRLLVRAAVLWAIGAALIATFVPVFVILPAYAILFVLALPFTRLRARTLFALAAAVALVMPWVQAWLDALTFWSTREGDIVSRLLGWHYPFPVWIAFLLAGLGLARAGIGSLRVQGFALAAGAALAAIGYGLDAATGSGVAAESLSLQAAVWTARPHSSGVLEVIGSGGFALAVLAACLLVCRTAVVWIVLPLRAMGSMPLTAYTAQIVAWAIWALIALGSTRRLEPFRDLEPFVPLSVGILLACTAWALLIGRGPLEGGTDRLARLLVPARTPVGAPPR
ncbi:heparan-alpha-glucosaminide N-acetyltransferase domain-containing protein [Microbacterium sp. BK668]|uniref:heparan-alpha-glucosaminide N-acetyltransferase domain-containing protein n=1 Tax=Microbacterium sp. BK668 TaxID=2512118 RepID=UPI001FB6A13B|nr:heparan-alpha-glucosaminide N-acetyltransferase domain-containing protein [Microbacterium sp. BK668]